VSNTTLSSNSYAGVALCTSPNNSISGDVVKLNRFGISLSYTSLIPVYSSNNTISGSLIADNSEAGIYLVNSSNCKVFNNEIVNNGVGVEIDLWDTLSKDNTFYHNNFIDNNVSVHFMVRSSSSIPANYWNDGYPIGGNYWSGNNATDLFSGPFQNETGGDGVCDKPYDLGENNKDNLPLVHPYGSIRNLNTSLSYLTIQSAINAADTLDGHTIFVKSGVYRESILLNKKLSLIGQNRDVTVLETAPELNITTIVANNVTLCNFTLRSSWKEAPSNGIRLINACYCKILNNLIFNKFEAIKIDRGSCNNLVQNNLLRDNQYGIFIKRRPNEDAVRGNVIYNNTIVHNSWNGIELAYVEGNIIESNILADNGGFGLEIPIYTPSYDNVIFHNNFMRNSWNNYPVCQAYDYYMFHNHWDSGGEGNFWGDYRGTDLDHDGIGDLAYFITPELNEIVKDQYPLMGNYSCYVIRGNLISLISNSTITDLKFEDTYPEGRLLINVTARTSGFSRIRLPRTLLDAPYQLTFDGKPLDFWELPCSNETFECLYISYPAGDVAATHQIEIAGITQVPEYSETFLLVITFAVAVTLTCTKRLKAVRSSLSLSKERVFQVVIFD
jgi:parallel beta-helix repeat protein